MSGHKKKPAGSSQHRERLYKLLPEIRQTAPNFDPELALKLLHWVIETNKKRKKSQNDLFADPLVLLEPLVELVGADEQTLYTAILYPAIRPEEGRHFETSHFYKIQEELFKDKDGFTDERFTSIRDMVLNVMEIRACSLIALPHSISSVDDALNLPGPEEAQNLLAYFILSKNNAKYEGAWATRTVRWYQYLVDMRENPKRYSDKDRLNAYYYTDKFYAPFCEYLALQKLKEDPTYSPQSEGKGFYRLKTALEEELIRQINPEAYEAIKLHLHNTLNRFGIEREHGQGYAIWQLFDLVQRKIVKELDHAIEDTSIPQGCIRVETRYKKISSIYISEKRTNDAREKGDGATTSSEEPNKVDDNDYVGIRLIINGMRLLAGALNKKKGGKKVTPGHYSQELHAACKKHFTPIEGRHKDFYKEPSPFGYQSVHNGFWILGQRVEIQFVDLEEHLNNTIGAASHFAYKWVGKPKQGGCSKRTPAEIMEAFENSGRSIVVRVTHPDERIPDKLVVVPLGSRVADLAKKMDIPSNFRAVVIDHNPLSPFKMHASAGMELRNGQYVEFQLAAKDVAANLPSTIRRATALATLDPRKVGPVATRQGPQGF